VATLKGLPSRIKEHFNPTSNQGQNFWSSGIAKRIGNIQQEIPKQVQSIFEPRQQGEIINPIAEPPTPTQAPPQTWEDLERIAGETNAPIPDHRYEEFNKPIPTVVPDSVPATTPITSTSPEQVLGATNGSVLGRSEKAGTFVSEEYSGVRETIKQAAEKYGVDPNLMVDIAAAESSLDAGRKASEHGFDGVTTDAEGNIYPYSSATGLFQFTDATWEDAIKNVPEISSFEQRLDPSLNALAAAYFISNGYLGKWTASEEEWKESYTDEELANYYQQ